MYVKGRKPNCKELIDQDKFYELIWEFTVSTVDPRSRFKDVVDWANKSMGMEDSEM